MRIILLSSSSCYAGIAPMGHVLKTRPFTFVLVCSLKKKRSCNADLTGNGIHFSAKGYAFEGCVVCTIRTREFPIDKKRVTHFQFTPSFMLIYEHLDVSKIQFSLSVYCLGHKKVDLIRLVITISWSGMKISR